MFKYIRQRILFAILALIVISLFSYVLIAAFAPNPVRALAEKNVSRPGNTRTYDEILLELEIANGIRYASGESVPILTRYFKYIGNIFRGDWGPIINPDNNPNPGEYDTIPKLFFTPLKYSILVSAPAFLLSSTIGTSLGIYSGYKRGKLFDSFTNIFVLIFIALPSFIIAPIAITIAASMGILPEVPDLNSGVSGGAIFVAYLPPIIVVTLGSLAVYTTYSRNQVITVLTSNYVLIAKSKGLSPKQIFFKYVLRNISIPIFALVFPSFLGLISGSIIVERFWNIKGTSQVIVYAFPSGEINIVMFSVLFFTLLSLVSEIITDITYAILDPRITYGVASKKNYWAFYKAYLFRKKLIKELFQAEEQKNNEKGVKNA